MTIWDALNYLAAWLCQAIYPLIAYLYRIFYNLGDLRIINNEKIDPIYNRVTLILGLAMLFFVVFQLIQYIIEPDNFSDKEKGLGKVMFRMIISVVLIGVVPTIFDMAFELQHDILENNLIPKIILGTESNYNEEWGGYFSASILEKFYTVNPNVTNYECTSSNKASATNVVAANITSLREDGSLETLDLCLSDKSPDQTENVIKFDGILAVLAGGLVVWMLAMYCLDLGVRVVQLTYLQIIAPVPIIMYMLPKKDGAFEKWVKQCITTFLDLFVRTAIICFVVLVISTLNNSFNDIISSIPSSSQGDKMFTALIYICLVLGIMTFAKKAGDMLKELLPKGNAASGELGLSTKNRIPEPAKRIAGAGIGLAWAGGVGAVSRTMSNVKYFKKGRQGLNELKNKRNVSQSLYDEAIKVANDKTKTKEERAEANKNAQKYKAQIAGYNREISAQNKRYGTEKMVGSVIGGFVAGTLSGANKGMIAGLTTKGGIGGVSKATKSVIEHNKAVDEWRNSGGTSWTDRTLSGVQQKFGIDPTANYSRTKERIEQENAAYDQYDKHLSAAEDRAGKLIDEGKYTSAKTREAKEAKNMVEIYLTQAGNLKRSDYASQEEFDKAISDLNRKAHEQDDLATKLNKEAREELVQKVMDGGFEDAVISNNITSAENVIKTHSGLVGFIGALFGSFKGLKDLNNQAKDRKSTNANELYTMQNSEEYKAAQANKKYNEGKK